MTYRQFKRLKPKYKFRILLVAVIALLLFIGVLFGISAGVSAIRTAINTTTVKDLTASKVLEKNSMDAVLDTIKPVDPLNLFVLDSTLVCDSGGKVRSLEMHLASLIDEKQTDYWRLYTQKDKVKLRKERTKYDNMKALETRKVDFKNYYAALSRAPLAVAWLDGLDQAGTGGLYTFTDNFDNNREPVFSTLIQGGLDGFWVSGLEDVSSIIPEYNPSHLCAPTVVSVEKVDKEKSKGKKVALLDPEDRYVVLFECAPYSVTPEGDPKADAQGPGKADAKSGGSQDAKNSSSGKGDSK